MKKGFGILAILAIIFIFIGLKCGCSIGGKAESVSDSVAESTSEAVAEAESAAEAESHVEIGTATVESSVELRSELSVSGVVIENVTEAKVQEPEFTFAQLFWNIYQDKDAKAFIRVLMICFIVVVVSTLVGAFIFLFGWITGNLGPMEKFSLRDKKSEMIAGTIESIEAENLDGKFKRG